MAFPTIGILGGGVDAWHFNRAATALGIAVTDPGAEGVDLITDLRGGPVLGDGVVVLVARSQHGQVSTWSPMLLANERNFAVSVTPVPGMPVDQQSQLQHAAIAAVSEGDLIGVVSAAMSVDGGVAAISTCPGRSWWWTLDASATSAYEQHARALLNLPLGATTIRSKVVVTAPIITGDKPDMYHPYLHLFARDPRLRVHQVQGMGMPGELVGHLTVEGDDLEETIERAIHAAEYFNGVVDE